MSIKNYQIDHLEDEHLISEKILTLRKSRSAYIGHITRTINKINEKLSLNENIKTIKCLEEQLYQILEKVKGINDEYIRLVSNPADIEISSEIYFEQHSRVTLISDTIEHFIIKRQQVQNVVQQQQYQEMYQKSKASSSKSKSSKNSKSTKSSKSSSSSSRESEKCKKAKAELLAIQAKERFDRKRQLLEKQKNLELELEHENVIEAQNKLQLIKLKERYEEDSILEDLEDIPKPEIYDNKIPPMSHKIDFNFSKEYLQPTKPPPSDISSVNPVESISNIAHMNNKTTNNVIEQNKVNQNQLLQLDTKPNSISSATITSNQIEPVDAFIDRLVEGQETILENNLNEKITVLGAVHQQLETRNLPPIDLLTFDGNPGCWPEFIENFKIMIHCKITFNDTIRLERLLSVLRGDAKRSVDSIGRNGIFYATTLKCLKREFGNPNVVSHIKLKLIFDQPQIKATDRTSLKLYHQKLKSTNTWLVSMGYHSTLSSIENVTKAVQRLPNYLRQTFYRHTREIIETDTISLLEFEKWLENRMKELFNPIADIIASQEISSKKDPLYKRINNGSTTDKDDIKCWFCSKKHKITICQDFIKLPLKDKNEFVKTNKLCWNCMAKGHNIKNCQSKHRCKVENCNKRHHTLLHNSNFVPTPPTIPLQPPEQVQQQIRDNNIVSNHFNSSKTFLQILPVTISNGSTSLHTNALLDPGSDATLVRQDISNLLNLHGESKMLSIGNALLNSSTVSSQIVSFDISSNTHPEKIYIENAFVVPNLNVKYNKVDIRKIKLNYPSFHDIELPQLNDADVTVLIGADCPRLHLQKDFRFISDKEPSAVKTELGWVLLGGKPSVNNIRSNRISTDIAQTIDVEKFWSIDTYGTVKKPDRLLMTKDEKQAYDILENSINFKDGHYEVGMLWKDPKRVLTNNKPLATQRLLSLEKRFDKNPDKAKQYADTIKKYVELGHAKKLNPTECETVSELTNYIPHHYVIKPKFRVVFDATAKYAGKSLNDYLLKGPDLLNNLVTVLLMFRNGQYSMSADIEKMFHQIQVKTEERDCLRFLWRENPNLVIDEYQMNVHLFGKNDSPCIANFSLKKSAKDQQDIFEKEVCDTVERDFYMDDFLKSGENIDNLIKLANELHELLSKRGFRLTKFISNNQNILDELPKTELKFKERLEMLSDENNFQKILGLIWNLTSDTLKLSNSIRVTNVKYTKRGLLSVICSIFDPLGFVAPCLVEPKLIIQELWERNIDWDQPIPNDLKLRAVKWIESLHNLSEIEIPRYYQINMTKEPPELHIFADSSSKAYGCAAYLRLVQCDRVQVAFIIGKSRLAPLKEKQLSIPKLELQAATIAVRMKVKLLTDTYFNIKNVYFWSDSKTVLKYIHNENKHFPVYVMHRLNEIRLNSNITEWHYIPTSLNISDICTRPINFTDFIKRYDYLQGPPFLQQKDLSEYLGREKIYDNDDNNPINLEVHKLETNNEILKSRTNIQWQNFSSWNKLLRAISNLKCFIQRFKEQLHTTESTTKSKVQHIKNAHDTIINLIQKETFQQELSELSTTKRINQKSNLLNLNPILDNNIIKVGGRLKNVNNIPSSIQHQIILPQNHPVTNLLILHYHEINHHCGRNQTLALIREKYWIVKGKSVIRKVLTTCLKCKHSNSSPKPQFMGDLPKERIAVFKPPFTISGVDCFGPIIIKQYKRTRSSSNNQQKRYGVIYTCLTTRAVHLELSIDMTTDSFLMTLRRFIARRGEPELIWCDNGTNFTGVEKELKLALRNIDYNVIEKELALRNIEWKFIPPVSPWMGGAWEIMVKLTKRALRTVTNDRPMYEEVLRTLFTEVESTLNSRPLTSLSDDPKDIHVLTPNHFLTGKKTKYFQSKEFTSSDLNNRKRWRSAQALANMFWARFIKEYLPTLQQRKKWNKINRNFIVNDIVLVKDENVSRSFWPLARIIDVHKGNDEIVRSCKLKLGNNTLVRPCNKLCLLEEGD